MNKYFQEAFNIVRSRRQQAEGLLEQTLRTLRQDDLYAKAESEMDTLGFELARLMSQNSDYSSLKAKYDNSVKAVAERAYALGFTDKDLKINHYCDRCKDQGMVDGKDCVCVKQLVFDMLSRNCVGRTTEIDSFEKVDTSFYPEEYKSVMEKRLAWLKKWGESFPTPQYNYVVLSGKVGTGKSFSMSVLANVLMSEGLAVLMLNSMQLNRLFLQYHLAPIATKEDIFAPLLDCDLLIIDDLGTESLTNNVTINYLYELIAMRDNMPIAVTTNLGSEQILARYGQRIYSRLFHRGKCMAISFDGIDLRQTLHK